MFLLNHEKITKTINDKRPPTFRIIENIVNKSHRFEDLDLSDIFYLLKCKDNEELFNYVIDAANRLKEIVFGNKIKIYVPLYITNICANNCMYCGFRKDNKSLKRKLLTLNEFKKEVEYVLNIGHRNIEIVSAYHSELNSRELSKYIEIASDELTKHGKGSIILMTEPMEVDDYVLLKAAGLQEVYNWQETYSKERYLQLHPFGNHKHDYNYRISVYERAVHAGIERVGMGVLFGLYNWEYDVLALMSHAMWFKKEFASPPYAFGIPRFKKAHGAFIEKPYTKITNKMYRLSVAIYRLAFPYTHTYMNTRENMKLIIELCKGGGSEVNTEASTVPGGYTGQFENGEQFFHYSYNSNATFKILQRHGFDPEFNGDR